MTSDDGRPAFSPSIALVSAARDLEARLAAILEPHGLTVRSYAALGHVATGAGVTPSDLSRRTRLTPEAVSTLVRTLDRLGLARSTPGRGGHPAPLVVTPDGAALLARLAPRVAALDADAFATPAGRELGSALRALTEESAPAGGEPVD